METLKRKENTFISPLADLGVFSTPQKIISLIAEISYGFNANKILDPACGTAALLTEVAKNRKEVDVLGVEINQTLVNVAETNLIDSELKYKLINADFFNTELNEKYDLVVCNPPFGMRIEQEIDGVKIRNVEFAFILNSLKYLKPNGYLVFIFPEGLLSSEVTQSLRDYVSQKYSLQAIISLPVASFQPYASIKTSLIILKNSNQDEKVFFAELSESQALKVIISNFQKHISNKNLSQGFWVDFQTIQKKKFNWTFARYKGLREFESKKASSKYPLRLLFELVQPNKNKSISSDTILIQRVGSQFKSLLKDELPEKSNLKNFIELSLLSEEVLPQYLKLYLNSEHGKKQLLANAGGTVIPSLSTNALEDIYIELPDLPTQFKIISTAQKLFEISTAVDLATQNFYDQLFNYNEISPLIEQFDKAVEKDSVYESLISPLAMSYRIVTKGSSDITSQRENYFKIFEMVAVFNSITLLSALPMETLEKYDKDIWTENKKAYSRAAFGHWIALYRRLANLYEKLEKDLDANNQTLLSNLPFGKDFYLSLIDSELIGILDSVIAKRNDSTHGGMISDITTRNLLDEMQRNLIKMFDKLFKIYSSVELIFPLFMKNNSGVYKITSKKLQGAASYINYDIETDVDMNTEFLYLYNSTNSNRLKLLPEFIRLIHCPTCGLWSIYFYNKIDGTKANYKCFQTEDHPHVEQISGLLHSFKN